MAEVQSIFRLGRRPGEGVFCDADGLLVSEVALLERSSDLGDAQAWRPRPLAELNRDLSRCYGLPSDYSKHPNRHAPGRTSTAAGAFQFNNKTWNEVASLLGLTDFTPASQRLAAAYKLNHAGAVAKLEKDDIEGAIFDAAKVWDCLPKDKTEKSKWGHPRPLQPILDSYNAALATLQTPKKAN
jgi:hypothetical protein